MMPLTIFLFAHGSIGHWLDGLINSHYPAHYVAPKVPDGSIVIDGRLDDAAWLQALFFDGTFVDIAEPLFPDFRINQGNATLVKLAWDSNFLYVGAEIGELYATGTVWGHNEKMRTTRPKMGAMPYFDNDFEVFVDVSMSNYYYKEFEVNFWNATYDVLWRGPDSGLGSIGVPCDQADSARWCSNSTFYRADAYAGSVPPRLRSWSMASDEPSASGLQSSTSTIMTNTRHVRGWTVEIRFPLRGNAQSSTMHANSTDIVGKTDGVHGGLLDAGDGMQFDIYDPNNGAMYWLINLSRAEHPFFNFNMTDATVDQLPTLCAEIMKQNKTLLGTDKWSCYWEWTWQAVGGHRYMHNPDTFGFLEFALNSDPKKPCLGAGGSTNDLFRIFLTGRRIYFVVLYEYRRGAPIGVILSLEVIFVCIRFTNISHYCAAKSIVKVL
eukprot:GEMP01050698.1.p1 GENE.GEMP01050698.1~~GEMP01050698.1.p1  ORF type:complete len:437 (+),score=60.93 GEMP01050698.1:74-1384(+)